MLTIPGRSDLTQSELQTLGPLFSEYSANNSLDHIDSATERRFDELDIGKEIRFENSFEISNPADGNLALPKNLQRPFTLPGASNEQQKLDRQRNYSRPRIRSLESAAASRKVAENNRLSTGRQCNA